MDNYDELEVLRGVKPGLSPAALIWGSIFLGGAVLSLLCVGGVVVWLWWFS